MFSRLRNFFSNDEKEPVKDLDQLDQLIVEITKEYLNKPYFYEITLKETVSGTHISELSNENSRLIILKIIELLESDNQEKQNFHSEKGKIQTVCFGILKNLLKRNIPLTENDLIKLLNWYDVLVEEDNTYHFPKSELVNYTIKHLSKNKIEQGLQTVVKKFAETLRTSNRWGAEQIKMADKLESALGLTPTITIISNEKWADQVIADYEKMSDKEKLSWATLFAHGSQMNGTKPSAKWEKQAIIILENNGKNNFVEYFLKWMPLVDKPNDKNEYRISELNVDILKGLVWYCKFIENEKISRAITSLAFSTFKKLPGIGPRAVKVGNACINVLGQLEGLDALGQLALLKVRIKFKPAQNAIESALTNIAEKRKIPRDEIEEMGVPAYGMEEIGVRREKLGDFTAELVVTGTISTGITWIKPDGNSQKSVPKVIADSFKDDLKELKDAATDIQKMLPAQRDRIDNLFLSQKEWDYLIWKERYLDHPLVGILGRKIIWIFKFENKEFSAIFHQGKLVNSIDEPIEIAQLAKVSLWHPIGKPLDDVLSWRDWLFKHEATQPFKQAHREIYLLTSAEKNTKTYSNRFASHIIKQHQFNALCGARGWKNQLRLMVDADYEPAHINLPIWNLRAEFWIEGVGEEVNESGTFLYLATDQVRFYCLDANKNFSHASGGGYSTYKTDSDSNQPLNLETIPPLVLSEIFRDVDLFVGVASVGNDQTWSDGGRDGRFVDYWHKFSFDNLTETANTRKSVLEKLIPKLKIANQCSFDNKFLIVKGEIRTYKIHLGSGNILMEPNDQYLCIVANQLGKKGENIMLPFEGDRTISIILSKAFLLADDKKIKDQTILSQIQKK